MYHLVGLLYCTVREQQHGNTQPRNEHVQHGGQEQRYNVRFMPYKADCFRGTRGACITQVLVVVPLPLPLPLISLWWFESTEAAPSVFSVLLFLCVSRDAHRHSALQALLRHEETPHGT